MVIEGEFIGADYEPESKLAVVTVKMILDSAELTKLQNGLANRRMNTIQMVINSTVAATVDPADTPQTSTESW